MGVEIVFVLIYPIAIVSLATGIGLWFAAVKAQQPTGSDYVRGYGALVAGFAVSMTGLALLTYLDCDANFTSLIQHGYYTESERPVYLPARVAGEAVVNLVFVLPAICFVVVPLTTKLIRSARLKLINIGLWAVIGWVALALLGWLLNLNTIVPPYSLQDFLSSTIGPALIYGLPIPLAALLLFPRKRLG